MPTPLERELARQQMAREQLIPFSWYTYRQYRIAAVHKLIGQHLQQVERYVVSGGREGIGRLMIFVPPRHGKSELVSVRFPAWVLGRNPDLNILITSCTADLATDFSRAVRNTLRDDPFQRLFGAQSTLPRQEWVQLAEDSRKANAWKIEGRRGGLIAAGVGGSIIGRGADIAIIDDPFKRREDAESKRERERVWSWYTAEFYSRLEPSGAIVLMHQRWHADDLAGKLLVEMVEDATSDWWNVLSLSAIAEPWPPLPQQRDAPAGQLPLEVA